MVELSSYAVFFLVKLAWTFSKVKPERPINEIAALSDDERGMLRMFAPNVLRDFEAMKLDQGEQGRWLFYVTLASCAWSRIKPAYVKSKPSNTRESQPSDSSAQQEEQPPTDPLRARPVDNEWSRTHGVAY